MLETTRRVTSSARSGYMCAGSACLVTLWSLVLSTQRVGGAGDATAAHVRRAVDVAVGGALRGARGDLRQRAPGGVVRCSPPTEGTRRTHITSTPAPSLARGGDWAGWSVHTPSRVPPPVDTHPHSSATLARSLTGAGPAGA